MKRFWFFPLLSLLVILGLMQCRSSSEPSAGTPPVSTGQGSTGEEKIFITDITGKKWDITHAVKRYGFDPQRFQFGLGPNAIRPILNPRFLLPGDQGYPADDNEQLVIGFELNGDRRAYPIESLFWFEVADDMFGDTPVAVGY